MAQPSEANNGNDSFAGTVRDGFGFRHGIICSFEAVEFATLEWIDWFDLRLDGTNDYAWDERDETIRLPVEPDSIFSLKFPNNRVSHFCYEADRGSMPMADMLEKFRAYHHFIKRQQEHKEAFGVHPIRAVLIETIDGSRARKLMELAQHRAVIGRGRRSALFWLTFSPFFTSFGDVSRGKQCATYLNRPATVLDQIWALPWATLPSIVDAEN